MIEAIGSCDKDILCSRYKHFLFWVNVFVTLGHVGDGVVVSGAG